MPRALGALGLAALLSACAVGPDFRVPPPPAAHDYGSASVQATPAGVQPSDAQTFRQGNDVPADWWTLYQSPPLNELVDLALRANPDLAAAQATLRQAQELYAAQRASLWPSVQGGVGVTRSRYATDAIANPTVSPSSLYTLYTAQVSVSYAPDVFGVSRRALEASQAQVQGQRFALEATYLTLTTNVVGLAVQEASLRAQVEATRRLLDMQQDLTQKAHQQRSVGGASDLDVLTQENAQAQIAATLPPLEKQLGLTRDALTALLGRLPSEEATQTFSLDQLSLPHDLPLSLPSQLVSQRPDVRAAEENLHAASAQVGVALGNMLPQFVISADTGSAALELSHLFTGGSGFWDAGVSLTQTLFDAGALRHRHKAAEAALDAAADQYRSAVIQACQNVADVLRALDADARGAAATAAAERAASGYFELVRKQQDLGAVSPVIVLTAEQSYRQAQVAAIQARASRYADTVALFQALGGGWWNRPGEKLR